MKNINIKLFVPLVIIVLAILIFIGFGTWYFVAKQNNTAEQTTIELPVTKSTNSIDQDVSDIDQEMQSVNENDFADSQLNDSQVGL